MSDCQPEDALGCSLCPEFDGWWTRRLVGLVPSLLNWWSVDVLGSPMRRGVSVVHSFGESGVVGLAECCWVVGLAAQAAIKGVSLLVHVDLSV